MKSNEKPYSLDNQIGFVLRLAVQFHTAIFTARIVGNLTQTQFAALAKIHEVGGCSQSDLGRHLTLDSATVNGVVDRMRSRGFIEVSLDPTDRRRQSIALTREGVRVIEEAQVVAKEITAETLSALSPTEQTRLLHLLQKMMAKTNGSAFSERDSAESKSSTVV